MEKSRKELLIIVIRDRLYIAPGRSKPPLVWIPFQGYNVSETSFVMTRENDNEKQ